MPPNYGELPTPENSKSEKQNINQVKNLIKNNTEEQAVISSSSIEENILDKIKKN